MDTWNAKVMPIGRHVPSLWWRGLLLTAHRITSGRTLCLPVVLLLLSYIIISHCHSVCCKHALVNGPTLKRSASDSGRCSEQLLMM